MPHGRQRSLADCLDLQLAEHIGQCILVVHDRSEAKVSWPMLWHCSCHGFVIVWMIRVFQRFSESAMIFVTKCSVFWQPWRKAANGSHLLRAPFDEGPGLSGLWADLAEACSAAPSLATGATIACCDAGGVEAAGGPPSDASSLSASPSAIVAAVAEALKDIGNLKDLVGRLEAPLV